MQYDVPWQRHTGHKGKGETGCSMKFCGRDTLNTKVRQGTVRFTGCSKISLGKGTKVKSNICRPCERHKKARVQKHH